MIQQLMSTQKDSGRGPAARMLSSLGANGLTIAMGLFGRSTPADGHYIHVNCCHLYNNPGDYNSCYASNYYTWGCSMNYYLHCTCVECPGGSALDCRYG